MPNTRWRDRVVREVERLQLLEVVHAEGLDLPDIVVLQVYLNERLQILQLFQSDMIVCQVDGAQVLEIAKTKLPDLNTTNIENAAKSNQLVAFLHNGFWHCMDTKRDKDNLDELWYSGNAPWK